MSAHFLRLRFLLAIAAMSVFYVACGNTTTNHIAKKGKRPPSDSTISIKDSIRFATSIQQFFDTSLPDFNGSYLIAKNGKPILEKCIGYWNPVKKDDPLTPSTAFHLASVSKTFTAMAVMNLWQEGKLGLEDTLGKYFPDFPYKGITIKMLLSHRSGLPNYLSYLEKNKWDKKKLVTNEILLNTLYTMRPPAQFKAGTRFTYCNTNFAMLALIVEKVTGVHFPQYMEETFFKPLEMHDTYIFTIKDTSVALPSFEKNNRKYGLEFLDLVYGDKNVYSTPSDLLKWDQALYPDVFFNKATLDSAFAPYSFEKPGSHNYGLGWRMTFIDNGKKILYHNGWWHGNNTVFIRLIDEDATIIVLGNKFNRKIYSAKQLCDLFGPYKQHLEAQKEEE